MIRNICKVLKKTPAVFEVFLVIFIRKVCENVVRHENEFILFTETSKKVTAPCREFPPSRDCSQCICIGASCKKYMDRDGFGVGDRQFFGHTHFAERSLQVRVLEPGPGHKLNAFSTHKHKYRGSGKCRAAWSELHKISIFVSFSVNLPMARKKQPAGKRGNAERRMQKFMKN